jgi:hypothetical protein
MSYSPKVQTWVRSRGSGRQDCPTGRGHHPQSDLRGRLPRFLLWVSPGAQPASSVGCAVVRAPEEESELCSRRRYSRILRPFAFLHHSRVEPGIAPAGSTRFVLAHRSGGKYSQAAARSPRPAEYLSSFPDLAGRIFGFESDAARVFSTIAADCRALGRPISHADAQIAAIAQMRGAKLATRNVADFEDCGLDVVDPWNGS